MATPLRGVPPATPECKALSPVTITPITKGIRHLDEVETVGAAALLGSCRAGPFHIGQPAPRRECVDTEGPRAQIRVLITVGVVPAAWSGVQFTDAAPYVLCLRAHMVNWRSSSGGSDIVFFGSDLLCIRGLTKVVCCY